MNKGYKPKDKLDSGSRFAKVSGSAAQEYVKKGYSPKTASKIGAAIAAKAGAKKFGQNKMTKLAKAGKK
jgi:hypothetical protein